MNKTAIKQFATEKSKNNAETAYSEFMDLLFSALDDTGNTLTYFTPENTKVSPIGEYANGTFIEEKGGEIEVFVAIADPQVVLSTKNLEESIRQINQKRVSVEKFKNKLKSRKKKKEPVEVPFQLNIKNTCQEVTNELFKNLINYFTEMTKLLVCDNGIKIFAIEELGFNFLIRIGTIDYKNDNMITSLWDPINMTLNEVDVLGYFEAMEDKNMLTRGNYFKLVRILKNFRKSMLLARSMSASSFNRYMIELIAYNVPNELLTGPEHEIFIKACNYLINVNPNKLVTFDNKPINRFYLSYPSSVYYTNRFMNNVRKIAYKL